ncbi:MAG: response regulator transcription factor [Spirochaetales bacterium]|nr:response regulator transcription factor [Spirochaetales bacterium]
MKERILVVEDEPGLLLALEDRLKDEGFAVFTEANGARAEEKARRGEFDLIVLDLMLPGRDGFQICQNLRESSIQTPILMLTAKGSNLDMIMGLRLGADDYLAKPFDMQVLIARMRALLRRSAVPGQLKTPKGTQYAFDEYVLDTASQELLKTGKPVTLNAQEYRLLEFFVQHPNRVYTRDELLDAVWGYEANTTSRTVDVHVAWLRRKIGEKKRPARIVTVRGYGYKFVTKER